MGDVCQHFSIDQTSTPGMSINLLLESGGKKPVKKATPTNVTTPTSGTPSSTSSPSLQRMSSGARNQFYSSSQKVDSETQTTEEPQVTTSEDFGKPIEEPTESTESTETETTEAVSTSDLIAKFKDLDKKAAQEVPAPIRPSDDRAFTVTPVRVSSKLATSGENVTPKSKSATTPRNEEWRGSLFDRLMSTPTKVSTPRETTSSPRVESEEYTQQAKKRVIDFANKPCTLNFSAEVIKHFEDLTNEDLQLDYNYFTFTYDFENNKKNVVFADAGKGLDQLREKLVPTAILHAIYKVELVLRSDLPKMVKYFLLTWTGEENGNLKRAHATNNVPIIENFFECAFVVAHITNNGPELVDDLERCLSKVSHEQTLWQ
jgi:hypothetical protein